MNTAIRITAPIAIKVPNRPQLNFGEVRYCMSSQSGLFEIKKAAYSIDPLPVDELPEGVGEDELGFGARVCTGGL